VSEGIALWLLGAAFASLFWGILATNLYRDLLAARAEAEAWFDAAYPRACVERVVAGGAGAVRDHPTVGGGAGLGGVDPKVVSGGGSGGGLT
jgi:hypothetical protein